MHDDRPFTIPLGETGAADLYQHWMNQAVSGLLSAFTNVRRNGIDSRRRAQLDRCTSRAANVPAHAKCVMRMMNDVRPSSIQTKTKRIDDDQHRLKWIGAFGVRHRRSASIRHANTYRLRTANDGSSAMGIVARYLTETVRSIKQKRGDGGGWRETLMRLREQRQRQPPSPADRSTIGDRQPMVHDRRPLASKWTSDESMDHHHQLSSSSMSSATAADTFQIPIRLLREAVKLGLTLAGEDTRDFDNKTLKLVSPRFLSLVPEENDTDFVNLFSPSLFSLHDEGTGMEALLSLPQIIGRLNNRDQQQWMDFVMEASGVSDAVEKIANHKEPKKVKQQQLFDDRDVKYRRRMHDDDHRRVVTRANVSELFGESEANKIDEWERLIASYTPAQIDQLKSRGYAFLDAHQLHALYGSANSSYYRPHLFNGTFNLESYANMTDAKRNELIADDIRKLSAARDFRVRMHDIVGSPFILADLLFVGPVISQPIILSPLILSPIRLSPAVLGPIILSPWVFVPLILSPRVLSPFVINPLIFSPIILSPLVLHPFIIVPGVFNPFVLSPFVLSPLILSPQVGTPLILTPFVLSPLILSPGVMNPLVLSPFVLSPIILSPQTLFALVLSPYAMSPLIESKLTLASVVASPSILS